MIRLYKIFNNLFGRKFFLCLLLIIVIVGTVNAQEPSLEAPSNDNTADANYTSFTLQKQYTGLDKLRLLTPKKYVANPDFGKSFLDKRFEDSTQWVELINKRTFKQRVYASITSSSEVIIQTGYDNLNYVDAKGWLRAVDTKLKPFAKGWSAIQQETPVYLYTDASTALSLGGNKLMVFNKNVQFNQKGISTIDYTVGDNGMYIKNAASNTDKIIHFGRGEIETDYRINQAINLAGNLVISEDIILPPGYMISENDNYNDDTEQPGSLVVKNADGKIAAEIKTPVCYDAAGNKFIGYYHFKKQNGKFQLEVLVDSSWLNSSSRKYPVTIDPAVTGPTATWAGGVVNSCLNSFGADTGTIMVTVPAGVTITNFFVQGSYFSPAMPLDSGKMYFWTPCGDSIWTTDGGPLKGLAGIDQLSFTDFVAVNSKYVCCYKPSCSAQVIPLTMGLKRMTRGTGCNATYLYYDPAHTNGYPFASYVIGHTVEAATAWSVSPNPVCGNVCNVTLSASANYGVPPYTLSHPWGGSSVTFGGYSTTTCTSTGDTTIMLTIPTCPLVACSNVTTLSVPPPTITDACGNTVSGLTAKSISINEVPSVINPAPDTLCSGTNVTIQLYSCMGGTKYAWSASDGASGTTTLTINDMPVNNGATDSIVNYIVTPTATDGCTGSPDTIPVVVKPAPFAQFNAGPSPVCTNTLVTAIYTGTVIAGATYLWKSPGGAPSSGPGIGPYTLSYPSGGSYTITLSVTANGCSSALASETINVSGATVAVSANPSSICLNSSATLTATNATSYTWTPATGLSATTGSSVIATPTVTTTYTVQGTGVCTSTQTVVVTVDTLPVIIVTPPTANVCNGGGVDLIASDASAYTWSPSTGLSATSGSTITATPTTTSTYTVTGTDGNGCVGTTTITVSVNSLVLGITPDTSVCPGGSVNLIVSNANTYTWSPATGLSATTGSSVTATPTAATTYTVTGNATGGCSATATVIVSISSLPVVNITPPNQAICLGQSASLTATTGFTYQWSPSAGLSATTGSGVTATPAATSTYTVIATNVTGCSASNSATVTIKPSPSVTVLPANPNVCVGYSTVLNASGGTTFQWAPATGLSAATGASVIANPVNTTSYTVSTTGANGCTGIDTVTVTVNQPPNVVVTPASPTVCIGQSITLTANGAAANTYQWSPTIGLSATTGSSVTASPASDTTYTVIATDINGCKDTIPVSVTVTPSLLITVTPTSPAICSGKNVVLTASGGNTYQWSPGNSLNPSTGSSVTADPINTTTYIVTGTNTGGCVGEDTLSVTVYPLPVVTASGLNLSYCVNAPSVTLTSGTPTGGTFSGAGVTGDIFNPSLAGAGSYSIVYTYTDTNGCVNSASEPVNVIALPDIIIIPDSGVICSGIPVTLTATGAVTYTWTPATGLSSTNSNIVISDATTKTIYTVTGTDTAGCVDSTTVLVTLGTLPQVAFFMTVPNTCEPQQVQFIDTLPGGTTYLWDFGDGTTGNLSSPQHTYSKPGSYKVNLTVSNAQGCVDSSSATETIVANELVAAPNAFSPLGNAADAYFTPHMLCTDYSNYNFSIYNRWGQLVFQTNDANGGWDGRYNGVLEPVDVYVYYIKFSCGTCAILKTGNITLVE